MGIKTSPQLHVCPACGSDLVQLMDFEPLEPGSCYVETLCPSCWWSSGGVHDQAAVDRLDEELSHGEAVLLVALDELSRSNIREEVERFARALAADAILPMDF